MLAAKAANQRARNLLRKIGIEHADERTVRDTVIALKSAWSNGFRIGASNARFDPGPPELRLRRQ
jgi:hypothetical protein